MFVGSGDAFQIRLGEAITTTNPHLTAIAVTSGKEVVRFAGVTSGVTARTVVSGDTSFIDEVTIYNADSVSHTVIPALSVSGAVRDLGSFSIQAAQSLHFKPGVGWHIPCQPPALTSGAVQSGHIASGSISTFKIASGGVLSSNIASGQIGTSHIASGGVLSGNIASGQIGTNHLANESVTSGNIASGAVSMPKLTSGLNDLVTLGTITTVEAISGLRCVNISQSGQARIAMAGVSGRMPVAGILAANVVSGAVLSPLSGNAPVVVGAILPAAGTLSTSGRFGLFLYCGMSGNVVTSVGITSGVVAQRVGYGLSSGFMYANIGQAVTSGLNTTFYGDF